MKKLFTTLLAALCLTASGASAQELQYKQVGTLKTGDFKFYQSYYPVYTMSKYGEGVTLYNKDLVGLSANSVLKEIAYFGYQSSDKTNVKFTVWVGNTTETTVEPFIIAGENEGNKTTTVVDKTKFQKFCEVTYPSLPAKGSRDEANEILTFTSDSGFTYTGENLVVYIELNNGIDRNSAVAPYITFFQCNNGSDSKCIGAYRDSSYAPEDYNGGYGINTRTWTYNASADETLPVMKLGYEGERAHVSATVKGRVVSSRTGAGINGATVTFAGQMQTTPSSGLYEFTVSDVDQTANYSITASAPGYDPTTLPVDIKAGGSYNVEDIVLTKQPVPGVLSGKVLCGTTAVPGATVTFDGQTATSAADGAYSISIANVDALPSDGAQITATARGYLPYSANLLMSGDMTYNINMEALPELPGEGTQVGEWNVTAYGYMAPFNPLWTYSEAQMVYPAEMLSGLSNGDRFSSVSFYGYFPESTPTPGGDDGGDDGDDSGYGYGDDGDDSGYGYGDDDYGYSAPAREPASRKYTVQLYLMETDATAFDPTAITPASIEGLTPYFDGEVVINTAGDNEHPVQLVNLPLDRAYQYGGKSLQMVVKATGTSGLMYFCLDDSYNANVIARAASSGLEDMAYNLSSQGVPVMRLGQYVPTAAVFGSVTDNRSHVGLSGVDVTLSGNGVNIKAKTNDEGAYRIDLRDAVMNSKYRLNFSYGDYYDETVDVTFTENELEREVNVEMENVNIAVENVFVDSDNVGTVYTLSGVKVLDNATGADVKRLPAGIYVIDGKKVSVK